MTGEPPVNPHLSDLLRTMISEASTPGPTPETVPKIVVNGSHNVFSWGGPVYVKDAPSPPGERQ